MKQKIKLPDKNKGNPLSLFGKYPDFPETFRNKLWERNGKLMADFKDQFIRNVSKKIKKNKSI